MSETRIEHFYNKNYKKLLLIPIILLIISISILAIKYNATGEFIDRDVSLQGGISATIYLENEVNIEELTTYLQSQFPNSDITVRALSTFGTGSTSGLIIDATDITNKEIQPILEEKLNIKLEDNYSVQEIGSSLGESFFKEMILAILFAFLFMGIVVFITFRKLVPSIAVILSALLDIIIPLAIISVLGFKLSTAGIAAFLMVIGYSVDTDILLTTRVLKRKSGTSFSRMKGAFKTGMTMTLTTIAALTVGVIVTQSVIIKEMFTIILIALIIDLISTWFMNASLLTWYIKRKENEAIQNT
ncbi:MAG: protein translocase subunit SecF [Nanoarchaeota archaeon]|nr:protein translocase subunit SecF [Nanoarchaeota archaeon]MBU1445581.1 protein translocase subunit SecF [Nanoarchaeota archaeon]MBU2406950.1 protein translocase subunit SecF [Nanoarchaeota archaeon]MBU2420405.1 protein translocase subunit SecF [Nanoarchaeota archaeon]MBU2475798.1 protein translocase subunit SecF [Nanoarchaeota archaeon]